MVGGLRAVYWTDVIQGIWMYIAVWAGSLLLTYKLFGGPIELWRRLMAERPDLLSLPGPEGFFTPGMWVGMTIALSFGIIFQPHMMIRYFTAASGRTLKVLGATTPIYLMTLFIPAAFVGLGGALILPDLASPDRVFPELLFQYAPPWLTGLILAGATAAAMSTLDSILHSNMTVLTRDVYQRYIAKDRSQGHYLAFGRCVVVVLLGVGFYLTVSQLDFLVTLVTLSGAGALQLMPAVLGVCYPGRRLHTAAGVVAGILAGLVTLYLTRVQLAAASGRPRGALVAGGQLRRHDRGVARSRGGRSQSHGRADPRRGGAVRLRSLIGRRPALRLPFRGCLATLYGDARPP